MPEERKSSRKWLIASIVIVLISIVGLIAGWWLWHNHNNKQQPASVNKPQTTVFSQDTVHFNYPTSAKSEAINTQDKTAKVLFKITNSPSQPAYLIRLRKETGLELLAQASKQPLLDTLLSNAYQQLPKRYPGYQQVKVERLQVGGQNAAALTFTYKNANQTLKEMLLIVPKGSSEAYYLEAQSKEADFDNVISNYFNPIKDSLQV